MRATEQSRQAFARMMCFMTSCPTEGARHAGLNDVFRRPVSGIELPGTDGRALFVSDCRHTAAVADSGARAEG